MKKICTFARILKALCLKIRFVLSVVFGRDFYYICFRTIALKIFNNHKKHVLTIGGVLFLIVKKGKECH